MDVELYIYDLSQGLARQFSLAIAGVQIDAIYHTAIVFGNVEYFFGQGVHRKVPGSTHHGRPMKILPLGRTELPREVIDEYLESLEAIYTPESYDLFLHNCNNFSQDLSTFLVGKSIPDEIRNLPETFLRTPMGQMLRGQLDKSMRQMTQAPDAVAGQNVLGSTQPKTLVPQNGTANKPQVAVFANGRQESLSPGSVKYPQNVSELDRLLKAAESSCAAIFFTSATCPPCKILYPVYDELAAEAGSKVTLIKVDVSKVYDIGMRYQVRATPTIMTFLKGKKDQEWAGADAGRLRGNIRLLVQMSTPQHAHTRLNLPSLQGKIEKPIMYTRVPPMQKLLGKLGSAAKAKPLVELVKYLESREASGMINTPVCDMQGLSDWFTRFSEVPIEARFACVDLLRVAAADPRVSSFLAVEDGLNTLRQIMPVDEDVTSWPYNLQAVTLQLVCNLFGSQVFQDVYLNDQGEVRHLLEQLASQCLLAEHHNARLLAAALIYNMAAFDHNERLEGRKDRGALSRMESLEAALVDAVVREDGNIETLHTLLLALGLMLYAGPADSSLHELCVAMEVRESLLAKTKTANFRKEPLLKEVGEELLAKGYVS